MKQFLAVILAFVGLAMNAQEIKWVTMNEALEAQKKNPKKIFVDVYADWCPPCKLLDKNTLRNKYVAKYINENFYAVKFNAEGNEVVNYKGQKLENPNFGKQRNSTHSFALKMGVGAYPTLLFFDEKANLIFPTTGYMTPTQIEPILKVLAENHYLKIQTQEDYEKFLKNFKGTFKD